ncbi:hypothetical protein ABT186_46930, partial [Streptomyces sp. NPDC001634]|uniref:hypothetical protein n=1 Tax=Streptomyces sp. NPDC001634 TaxID=3154390 RepID=UPI003331D6DB
MASYGTMLIRMPLGQAAPVLREVCAAGYATSAGPRFCLVHPDRSVDDNGVFALAGPISAELGAPVLAAFQYDGDRLELEVWRGVPLWVSSTRGGGLGVVEGAVAEHREEHVGS